MTKRATAIRGFVATLSRMTMDSAAIKLAILGANASLSSAEGIQLLHQYECNLQAYLTTLVEHNEEQAEALMNELGLVWKDVPPTPTKE